jgi:hypothetical protein
VLYIVEELSDVYGAVRVNFLSVFVANAIVKVADELGAVVSFIAAVSCHCTIQELTSVLIAIVEIHCSTASTHAFSEFAFVNTIVIVEGAMAMNQTLTELTFILQF